MEQVTTCIESSQSHKKNQIQSKASSKSEPKPSPRPLLPHESQPYERNHFPYDKRNNF